MLSRFVVLLTLGAAFGAPAYGYALHCRTVTPSDVLSLDVEIDNATFRYHLAFPGAADPAKPDATFILGGDLLTVDITGSLDEFYFSTNGAMETTLTNLRPTLQNVKIDVVNKTSGETYSFRQFANMDIDTSPGDGGRELDFNLGTMTMSQEPADAKISVPFDVADCVF